MQFPIKAHYATVAMLGLALRHEDPVPVAIREIADEHSIPLPFLTQILQQLKAAGLVVSSRGSCGGYRLQRNPSEITLSDIVDAVCPLNNQEIEKDPSTLQRTVLGAWQSLDSLVAKHLKSVSLSDLKDQCVDCSESMFYI